MANKQSLTILEETIGEPRGPRNTRSVVVVEMFYRKGSGYYISGQPETLEDESGMTVRSFWCFSNTRPELVESAPRFNAAKMAKLAETWKGSALVATIRAECIAKMAAQKAG